MEMKIKEKIERILCCYSREGMGDRGVNWVCRGRSRL